MNIAIIRLSAMGDIVHSAVVLQFIKKVFPHATIDWIVEKSMAEILKYNPDIKKIIELELKKFKKTKKISDLIKEVKKIKSLPKYDYIIDIQGLIKSSIITKFMNGTSYGYDKQSIRESFASYFYDQTINIPYETNTIDRNIGIVSKIFDFKITSNDVQKKQAFLFYKDENPIIYEYLSKEKKNVIFVIGSTWPSRNYPKEKFVEIANQLKENILIIWGTEHEKQDAEYIAKNSTYAKVIPRTDLNTLKALIDKSDLLIGNDTGPTHIAWGMNKASITIFGPTPTSRIYVTQINKLVNSSSSVNPLKLNKQDFSIRDIKPHEICVMAQNLLKMKTTDIEK